MLINFDQSELDKLWQPQQNSRGEDNGQVTIIGGSKLFHGPLLLALKSASRIVDMVFLASPEPFLEQTAAQLKGGLASFIWVPWEEVDEYIKKSEAVLVGPGFMRFHSETAEEKQRFEECDDECQKSMEITKKLLEKFPEKKWVIDGGSLQVIKPEWIPEGAVITPNIKEYELLFNSQFSISNLESNAKLFKCIVVYKGPVSYVSDGETTYEIGGGNAGLTKGGTGDVLAGLTVGLLAKNPPLLAAAAASFVVKKTAEMLYEKVGFNFNADDVAENCFEVMNKLLTGKGV